MGGAVKNPAGGRAARCERYVRVHASTFDDAVCGLLERAFTSRAPPDAMMKSAAVSPPFDACVCVSTKLCTCAAPSPLSRSRSLRQQPTSPVWLAGRDVIGLAQTGSGKTGAFALPILEVMLSHISGVTRERCTCTFSHDTTSTARLKLVAPML
jgi:hypothetical protein